MNNQLKKQNTKYVVIAVMIVLLLVGILAFSLIRGRANPLVEGSDVDNSIIFSSYEEYNGKLIKTFVDNGSSIFYDNDNNVIYNVDKSIDYFRILNENAIVYVASYLDSITNKYVSDVVFVNLESKTEEVLITKENLFLEVSKGSLYIVDAKNGKTLYGDKDNLKTRQLNKPISKIVCSRGKIFAINHTVVNNVVRSTIYCLTEEVDNIICPGKVQSVSVDYINDNIVYYYSLNLNNSISSDTSIKSAIYKKYLLDLSASPSEPKVFYNLDSNVISIKDRYLCVDEKNNSLYLLNNNFEKIRKISSLHSNNLSSLLKVSTNGEHLYYIDSSGSLNKL